MVAGGADIKVVTSPAPDMREATCPDSYWLPCKIFLRGGNQGYFLRAASKLIFPAGSAVDNTNCLLVPPTSIIF